MRLRRSREIDYSEAAAEAIRERSTARSLNADWYVIEHVVPRDLLVVWNEVQFQLRLRGIVHENPAVEAGQHFEVLMAEFLAGSMDWCGGQD